MLPVSLFDFDLPDELIARYPAERRDGSRMLVVDRKTGDFEIRPFSSIVEYLSAGDALLCNDALVRRARMFGRKEGREDGAKFEILLLAPDTDGKWNVMLKPGKRALPGTKVVLLHPDGTLNQDGDFFTVVAKNHDNSYKIEFSEPEIEKFEMRYGHMPLPPYLNREAEALDIERYQTVYAKVPGAVAAPTAGLHFTPELLQALRDKGVAIAPVMLHVGLGTFRPVKEDAITDHVMHTEFFSVPAESARLINERRAAGGRVICVGTTSCRTLESASDEQGIVHAMDADTGIFIYPGYKFKAVDALITNFHLPESTLLMLVSAFYDRENVMKAYEEAVGEKYRFFSFGDAMFIC